MKKLILITFLSLMSCLKNTSLNLNKINYKIDPYDNKINKLIEDYLEAKKNQNFEEVESYFQQLKKIILTAKPSDFSQKIPNDIAKEIEKYTFRKINNSKGAVLIKPNYGFETLNDTFINYQQNYNKLLNSPITKSWFELIDLKKEYVELLLEAGVPINMETAFGENLLHKACYEGNLDLVIFLIEKGINVNKKDRRLGFSPILFCLKNFNDQSFDIVKRLIKANSSLLLIDNENKTILHHFYKPILLLVSKVDKKLMYYDLIKFFKISLNTILNEKPKLISIRDNQDQNAFYDYFSSIKEKIKDFPEAKLSSNTLVISFFYNNMARKNKKSFIDFLALLSGKFFDEDFTKKYLRLYEIKFEGDERIIFKNKMEDLCSFLEVNTLILQENKNFFKYLFQVLEQDNIQHSEISFKLKGILKKALVLKKYEIVKMLLNDPYFLKFNLLKDMDYLEHNMLRVNLLNHTVECGQNELFESILPSCNISSCDEALFIIEDDINLNTTPLSNILKRDNRYMFKLIIKREALNLFEPNNIGCTCSHNASEFNRLERFQKLIELLKIKIQKSLVLQEIFVDTDKDIEAPLTTAEKQSKNNQNYQSFIKYIDSLDFDIIKLLRSLFIEIPLGKDKKYLTSYKSLSKSKLYFIKSNFENTKKRIEKETLKFWIDYKEKFPLHHSIAYNNIRLFNNNLSPIYFDSEKNQDWNGKNPLHIAVEKSNKEIVERILSLEYDLVPIIFKNIEIKEIRKSNLYSKEDLKIENFNRHNQNTSPFNKAIYLQSINILNLFLNYLALKESDEEFKIEFLEYALFNQKLESFKIIYESISEANKKKFSQQILINTIRKVIDEDKNFNIIYYLEFLLKGYPRENINLNSNENNPLLLAIERENEFLIEFLISHGADLRLKINRGIPIAYYSLYKKNREFITKLFEMGAFGSNTSANDNPLHFCIQNIFNEETAIDEDFFRFIIEKFNYCINQSNSKRLFPLHLALFDKKGFHLSEIIIQSGISINKQDVNGNTLLHILFQNWIGNGIDEILKKCLLSNLITLIQITNLSIENKNGESCLDYLQNNIWKNYGKKYARKSLDKEFKNKLKELRCLIEKYKK